MSSPTPQPDRSLRVYVSSTFRDMQEERDVLIKQVFPYVRELCERRGVAFSGVDLRWGITAEEIDRGDVVPICLAEVDRCRPYFIGLLGERYGWIPETIPQELMEVHPWLTTYRDRSINELEIQHAVLNDPIMATRACVYFRDPQYVDRFPAHRRADFVEQNEAARHKMRSLKDRIRQSCAVVREGYPDPQTFGQWVLKDLTTALDEDFPANEIPDPLAREAALHEAFARSRARLYIGRPSCFERLDAHVHDDGPPLVVLGESGSGKSALLANWAIRHREQHPEDCVLCHFLDAGADSVDWMAMLRRIMAELGRYFDIDQNEPTDPAAVRAAFPNWLNWAASQGRVLLVLDGLDRLPIRDGAADLVWLPKNLPSGLRLVVSSLPGRSLAELTARGWPQLQVQPLTQTERLSFIEQFLGLHGKRLEQGQAERIAECPQTANPLYLTLLLDELRVFVAHEELSAYLDYHLAATSVDELYQRILDRYEQDYAHERPRLVRDALSLLAAAREGLSETDLLELIEQGEAAPLRFSWTRFRQVLHASLVERLGRLCLANEYIRRAVFGRYLAGSEAGEVHRELARKLLRQIFFPIGDNSFQLNRVTQRDAAALKHLPSHARQADDSVLWNAAMTDFAYLQAVVSLVDVSVGYAADGSEIAWHEGYFLVLDEIREWLTQTGATSRQTELAAALMPVWERHPEFVKSAARVVPTLYQELNASESRPTREVVDRETRRIKLEGGPLWSWCERERQKYKAISEIWQPASREVGDAPPEYAAFISYRREGGADTARLIREALLRREQRAFLDVVDLGAYHFDDRILQAIEQAPNFLAILSQDCLVRCVNEDDWLRREVAHAINTDRNIIPILKPEFAFPDRNMLPTDMAELPRYNGVVYSHEYFDATIDRILEFFR